MRCWAAPPPCLAFGYFVAVLGLSQTISELSWGYLSQAIVGVVSFGAAGCLAAFGQGRDLETAPNCLDETKAQTNSQVCW